MVSQNLPQMGHRAGKTPDHNVRASRLEANIKVEILDMFKDARCRMYIFRYSACLDCINMTVHHVVPNR